MGQIIGSAAKPKRCNLQSLSSLGTPAAGEHILVSTDNSAMQNGQGNFDAYVVGDGTTAATALELKSIADSEIAIGGLNAINSKALYIDLESEIILSNYTTDRRFIGADGKWKVNLQSYAGKVIPVTAGTKYKITASAKETTVCFLKSLNNYNTPNGAVDYATGYSGNGTVIAAGETVIVAAPEDANYIYIVTYTTADKTPQYFGTIETKEKYISLSDLSSTISEGNMAPASSDAIYKFGSCNGYTSIDLASVEEEYAMPAATGKWVVRYSNYKGKFIRCNSGEKYLIIGGAYNSNVVVLKNKNYASNADVDYATGYSGNGSIIPANGTIEITIPEDGNYVYVLTNNSSNVNVEPAGIKKSALIPVKDVLDNTEDVPNVSSTNLVSSKGIYSFVKEECNEIIDNDYSFIVANDFASSTTGTYNPTKITIGKVGSVFTIESIGSGGRAMIYFPTGIDLVVDKEYTLSFDYTCTANETCWWWFSSSPTVTGDNANAFSTAGTSGHKNVVFTYATGISGFYIASSNFVGETVTVSNFSITTNYSIREKLNDCSERATTAISTSGLLQTQIEEVKGQVSLIGSPYDEYVSWKSYTGNPIIPRNRFGIKELATFGAQGMAIYNNIAFFFTNAGNTFNWYNILNGESATGCPLGFGGTGYHCNSASFSNIYYNENDSFPLLYIGGMEGNYIHEVKVVRVVPSGDSYTASLIQTITIPSYANIAMEGEYMYLNGDTGLHKYVVPPIFDGNDEPITAYTLTDSDLLKTWTIYVPNSLQGCCMHNGVFYQLSNEGIMLVFDTITETEINRVTMSSVGINYEQEDLDFSRDTMFLSCAGHFYRVWLD